MKTLMMTDAKYAGNLSVLMTFNDGHSTTINFGEWIRKHPHPQYNRFLDEKKFKSFYIDHTGNIAWGKGRDLYFPIADLYDGRVDAL